MIYYLVVQSGWSIESIVTTFLFKRNTSTDRRMAVYDNNEEIGDSWLRADPSSRAAVPSSLSQYAGRNAVQ
jgi:hypothetical protein